MRPCIFAGFLGLFFGCVSVAYGQDVPLITQTELPPVDINSIINLGKTFGWPLSFGYMLYRAVEKLLKTFEEIRKDIRVIRRVLAKENANDLDV